MGGMYSTSHLDDGIEWFTGNTLEASSDRPRALRARGLSDEASRVFPVNHSMPSSNYNLHALLCNTGEYCTSAGVYFHESEG